MINIVVSSKPVDGLFYYSYEYCTMLNENNIDARVVVICHRKFARDDYLDVIKNKYIHCKNIVFEDITINKNDVTFILGRSMLTLAWQDFDQYTEKQKNILRELFGAKLISVYSENHPTKYPLAVNFFQPAHIVDLCDTEVYLKGVGKHFEKTINFDIYKPHTDNIKFKHLFLGTNERYYQTVEKVIKDYPDHGILTYNEDYVNKDNNNVFVPVDNIMSMFDTYVYTKDTFDPAPRIFQECKYFGKQVIYLRDKSIHDGGSVYWNRDIKKPNIEPIVEAVKELHDTI
tara:strand:+ start:126 stop:986 length:861 start_codon:yes stop_codon:yes gene_type:complete